MRGGRYRRGDGLFCLLAIFRGGRWRRNFFDRRNEPVSPARQGFDVSRGLGRIPQRFPNARDWVVEAVVEIDEGVSRPQLIAQFLSRDQVAGGLQQNGQPLQRLTLEAKLYDAFAQVAGAPIQLEIVEAVNRGGERSRSGQPHIRGTSASLSHSRGEYLFCEAKALRFRGLRMEETLGRNGAAQHCLVASGRG